MFDSHCHAWRRWPYDTRVPDPSTRGSVESLLHEMDSHGVERAAVVCARIGGGSGGDGFANEDNNEYVSAFAAAHPDRLTAWIDLDSSWRVEHHTPGAVDRLIRATDSDGVSGFTHYFRKDNDGWLRSSDADELFATAQERSLIASLSIYSSWMEDLRELALRHPSVPILVHHLGVPQSEADKCVILGLSSVPSIGVKVSGFNYSAVRRWDFPYEDVHLWYRQLVEAYGPYRLFWGSDWPASRDQLTYRQSIEVVRQHSAFLSSSELDAVLGGNLERLLADRRMPE